MRSQVANLRDYYGAYSNSRNMRNVDLPLNFDLVGQLGGNMRYSLEQRTPFGSYHPGGAHFVFGDGHVEFINEDIDLIVYRSLATKAGDEVIGEN